jgi:penicillin-insensitive murein DD-endopeptidase
MFRGAPLACCLCSLLVAAWVTASAAADVDGSGFSQQKTPAAGAARSIGDYSAGCLRGAKALPLDGAGYQVMHPSRLRYYGHPALIDFIKTLGRAARAQKLGAMLVGDLSQPRGGRAPGGHASHQTGLDVDIWYWRPKGTQTISDDERETTKSRSVLDAKTKAIAPQWATRVSTLLQLTASDARVARVFVHPLIKRQLCTQTSVQSSSQTGLQTGIDRAWLSKIRPWYGHDDHFHVRLACPKDSPECVPQAAVPEGDGCGEELDFWFSAAKQQERERGEQQYQSKVAHAPQMPAQCAQLLME